MSSYWAPTPVYSYDDYLEHSGTKGMRWGYNDGRRNGKRTAQEIELDKKIELYKRSYEDNIAKAKEYKAAGDKKNYDIAIRNAYHARNKGIQYTNERKNISNNAGYKIGYALGSGAKKIEDAVKGKSASSNVSKSVSNKSSIDISNSRPRRVASGTAHVSKGKKVNTNGPLGSSKKITRGTGAEPLSAINYEKEPKNNTTEKVVNKIKTVSKKAVSKIESVVKDQNLQEAILKYIRFQSGLPITSLQQKNKKR